MKQNDVFFTINFPKKKFINFLLEDNDQFIQDKENYITKNEEDLNYDENYYVTKLKYFEKLNVPIERMKFIQKNKSKPINIPYNNKKIKKRKVKSISE